MKKFNFIYLLLAFVGVLTLTSCEHKYADYTPGAQDANMGAYLPSTADFSVTATSTSVDIVVARVNTAEAAQVSVRAEDTAESGLFTFPSSVSFAAGAETANFTISFDGSKLEIGKEYAIHVQIDQAEASTYATSDYVYTIAIPEPWNSLGTGTYVDDYFRVLMAAAGSEYPAGLSAPVKFEQHAENPNRIRVVNPAAMEVWGYLFSGVPGFVVFSESNTYLEFDVTDPNNVLMSQNPAPLGFDISFSDIGACPAALYIIDNEDGSYAAPITYADGIIKFPQGGVIFGYQAPDGLSGWYANDEGQMMYCMPGVELTDYSLAANYAGMIVSADNTTTTAIIEFTLGADVEGYKFVVVPGAVEDLDATVASIVDGSAEGIVEATAEQTQYQVELVAGNYTVVAVAYAGGEAVGTPASTFFYFPGAGGEKPEAQVAFMVESLANIFAEDPDRAAQMEANYPAEYFVGIVLGIQTPAEVTGMRFYFNDRNIIEGAIESGNYASYAELVDEFGNDVYSWVEGIEQGNIRILNLPAGSDSCFLFAVDTIYGTTQYYHYEYAMPAYSGNFPLSQYVMSEGDTNVSVNFTPGTDAQTIFVEFDVFPGFQFYAGFDEAAQTLTLDGWAYGYEAYESLFGIGLPVGPDDANPYLCLVPFTDDTQEVMAQTIEIKLAENAPAQLNSYFSVFTADKEVNVTGVVCKFTPAAVFSPAAAAQSLTYASDLKKVNVDSVTENIEVARKPIVVKPYSGNYVREYSINTNGAMMF